MSAAKCVVVAIFIVTLPIAGAVWLYWTDPNSLRQFPAPSFTAALSPFWGIYHNAYGKRYKAIEAAHRRLGPVIRIGPSSLSFSEPQAYKEIYGHGSAIIKGTFYDNVAGDHPSMGDVTSRSLHSKMRKNVSAIFSAKNVVAMEPKVVKAVENLLAAIKTKALNGKLSKSDHYMLNSQGEFDVRPWMNMFSFDAFSDMLWSAPYGFLTRGDDECEALMSDGKIKTVHAMMSFQDGVHFNGMCAQLSPFGYKLVRRLTSMSHRKQAADEFEGMARLKTVNRLKYSPVGTDFFSFLPLEATEKHPEPMALPDLVAECTNFLNAGNDTTQIALTNTIYQLACNPAEQDKLYRLLTQSLPETSQPIAPHSELSKIPYLTACLDESMRLMPPVRYNLSRKTVQNGSTIRGYHIPAGVTVSASVYIMHRNELLFPRAHEYVPSRWLSGEGASDEELKSLRDFVLPFSLGGRACIGRNLAYMEICICLAALVMSFEWRITDEAKNSYDHFERINCGPIKCMMTAVARG